MNFRHPGMSVINHEAYLHAAPLHCQFLTDNGDNEIRTRDLLLARQALSQLSYTPKKVAPIYSPTPSPVQYHRPPKA